MIYAVIFLLLVVALMAFWVWCLSVSVRNLIVDGEYMRYCINFLSANNYLLIGTHDGRELTEEEDLQLAIIQKEVSDEAEYLGMIDPFPRPKDITTELNHQNPD